jgi:hypothetical protein
MVAEGNFDVKVVRSSRFNSELETSSLIYQASHN